ncbi:MAG: AAA family ATPase [Bacteroidia bacterium]|nr:AAA family ATPase [Bacteroidia bacterium]
MKSPFKFLDSYTKDDREIFFGRDREIEELYQKIFDSKLLLVYGISGTGKSSLIHCGLANKFQETDWLPLVIRRGANIIESMAAVIKAVSITRQEGQVLTSSNFKRAIRSLYLDYYKPVYFIFDQFEELFIFGNKEEKHAFIQVIKSLLDSDLQCRFIFILREEYMANITEFERFIPTIFINRVRVEKMSHRNALEAIKEPCKVFNISLEEGFAESLLEKLSPESTDVELTYLQVFLDKIFRLALGDIEADNEQKQLSFTLALLNKIGNVSDLLGSFLDEQISLMDDPDIAMTVLKAFVSGKGTKRPSNEAETIDNVHSLGKEISPELVTELLQTFVNLRVLRDKDDHGRYELRHDALAEKIFEKFSLAEKELLEIRQLIENAYQYYLKRKILLSNDDLTYISNKDSLLNLNAELRGFLQESRKHQMAKIKTVRRLTAISILVFVLLMGILAYFILNRIDIIAANYAAVKSLSQTRNFNQKLKLAVSAWENSPTALPKEALLKVFNDILNSETNDTLLKIDKARFKPVFDPAPSEIQFAACSGDNKYIYGYSDSLILMWETTGKLYRTIRSANQIIDIKISGDSKFLGVVNKDSLLEVYDIPGNQVFKYKIRYNFLNTKQIFRFTGEDNIIALSPEHDAVLLNHEGSVLQTFDRHTDEVNAVDISGDNNFIATASSDKTIIIWYMNSVKKKYDYYNTLTWHRDTVWSVSFSARNIFVLSASADSTIKVGSLNNEGISEDMSDKKFFPKDKKYCYAEFSASSRGIIANSYEYTGKESKNLFFGTHIDNPTCRFSAYTTLMLRGSAGIEFSYFVFSPDENYFIYQQNNKTYLADTRLVFASDNSSISNLMEITGSKQFFTVDGKFILSVCGSTFQTYFVDLNDISEVFRNKE